MSGKQKLKKFKLRNTPINSNYNKLVGGINLMHI